VWKLTGLGKIGAHPKAGAIIDATQSQTRCAEQAERRASTSPLRPRLRSATRGGDVAMLAGRVREDIPTLQSSAEDSAVGSS
jgi:hypothetical protein